MSRRSGACLRCCLVIFAVVSALGVCGPAIYWRFKKTMRLSDSNPSSCPPCACDCPPPLSLLKIAPGISHLCFTFLLFPCLVSGSDLICSCSCSCFFGSELGQSLSHRLRK
ncbi:hypothetical protein LINGRAHAP2_LOCUS2174 [Linum grandiflorum]